MKTKIKFKLEKGRLYKAIVPVDVRTVAGLCPFCNKEVYVSSGQLLKYLGNKPTHKICRKKIK